MFRKSLRTVFMGTGPFGLPSFEALDESSHQILGLITKPDRRHGRGKLPPRPLRQAAASRNIDVFEPDDINSVEGHELLYSLGAQVAVVCDYGQILSAETLSLSERGGINLHGSLLPAYRGAAPVPWAILSGETQTGITVIHMTPKLDAGPALVQRATRIGPEETAEELEGRLARLGVEPVLLALDMLADWDRESTLGTLQDPQQATRAPRLRKEHGNVDWSEPAEKLRNRVRALKPWPGTFTHWRRASGDPLRLILDDVSVARAQPDDSADQSPPEPGTVVVVDRDRLEIATGDGRLAVNRIQPAGKRVMQISEFLRGHPLQAGERFGDPD